MANCILLFAYGRAEAFPIDVWVERVLRAGAKGYIDEAAPIAEFQQAIHIVGQGSIWAPRPCG